MKYLNLVNLSLIVLLGLAFVFFVRQGAEPISVPVGADTFTPVGGQNYTLFGGGVGTTDTSITVSSLTYAATSTKVVMSHIGDIGYLTLEPGNTDRQEFVSFTGITQNADGTATFTGVTRGLLPYTPYTSDSTLQKQHPGGSTVVLSNPPQLYAQTAIKGNDESITGIWDFASSSPPRYANSPTLTGNSLYFASVGYADALVNQGAATSTESNGGIVELATAAEQAATFDGGADKPTVLQSKYATSTPGANNVAANHTIIADSNGFLGIDWISSALTYAFGNLTATNATTTNATTTNFTISSITSSLLKTNANGLVTAASAGTDYAPVSYTFATTTQARATNGYASTTAFTIPANIITASSTINVRANIAGSESSTGAGTCTFYLRDDSGNTLTTGTWSVLNLSDDSLLGEVDIDILANNSTSAQLLQGTVSVDRQKDINAIRANYRTSINTTSALDFTSAVNLVGVVQSSASLVNCDINSMWIKVN